MKIALADRHPVLRRGLILALSSKIGDLTIAESDQLLALADSHAAFIPDIIIIGLDQLPTESPENLIQIARNQYPVASVIILDYTLNPTMAHLFLSAGAMGYLSKEAGVDEIIECVQLVLSGKRHMQLDVLLWMLRESKSRPYGNPSRMERQSLSNRETEIAVCIASGMPAKWIAEKFNMKQSNINAIKSIIFRKLGIGSTMQLKQLLNSRALQ